MVISTRDRKLQAALEDEAACKKQYGDQMTKKIMLRRAALRAAESLFAFWPPKSGSERCHELKGDLAGVFSIDLKQPYRLLFKPAEADAAREGAADESPDEPDRDQKRWKSIKAIELLRIEDTHG